MSDFTGFMDIRFRAVREQFKSNLKSMLDDIVEEARSLKHLDTINSAASPTEIIRIVDDPDEPIQVIEEAPDDSHMANFQVKLEEFQKQTQKELKAIFITALNHTRQTARVALEKRNIQTDEDELRQVERELVGDDDKRLLKQEGLTISTFLSNDLPHDRKCCKFSFRNIFAKQLKRIKKDRCKETGERAYLKYQNHFLGFAYMKKDRALMMEVMESLSVELEACHQKHLRRNHETLVKKEVQVKKEQE